MNDEQFCEALAGIEKQLDESLDRNIKLANVYRMLIDCKDDTNKMLKITIKQLCEQIESIKNEITKLTE